MTDDERAELEAHVRAGAWLKTGKVAKLLGMSRTKVHNMCEAGLIGYRLIPGAKVRPQRECDPQDVLRLLDASRVVHRGDSGTAGAVEADDAS